MLIECKNCGITVERKREAKWCSDKCRMQYARAYNAGSIKIHEDVFDPVMDWRLSEDLAHHFTRPVEWIQRSIRACREAGESPQYFIDRYLNKKDVPMNKQVDILSRQIQRGDI